jgi:AhpD family alkylhydroperoxidase
MESILSSRVDTVVFVISQTTLELIYLIIGIAIRRDGCIKFHAHGVIEAGLSEVEIMDAIDGAIKMGGVPAVVCSSAALKALRQFPLN